METDREHRALWTAHLDTLLALGQEILDVAWRPQTVRRTRSSSSEPASRLWDLITARNEAFHKLMTLESPFQNAATSASPSSDVHESDLQSGEMADVRSKVSQVLAQNDEIAERLRSYMEQIRNAQTQLQKTAALHQAYRAPVQHIYSGIAIDRRG
ncbi:MAG: hypothetical protein K6T83_01775 [Alicyclobacillus sp.]|nr:hypothetical protein [Alicyclobacillus sp.]